MPLFDLPLEQLRTYQPEVRTPPDFDAFWQRTLDVVNQFPLEARFDPHECGLQTLEAFDVTFIGYGGQPIKGWLILPRVRTGRLPCIVEYIGYGGGRGFATDWLLYASLGYAHLVMDTRGQGSWWKKGDTPDPEPDGSNPQYNGFMTKGILSKETYYYRRVFTDAARAIQVAKVHPSVDATRIAVTGGSQGGGISIAAAALEPSVAAVLADVPFLSHYRRATEMVDTAPYNEISRFCQTQRHHLETVFETLSYFDGVNFAPRIQAPALVSVGLMDNVCPPSTIFAMFNRLAGQKEIVVYPYNNHEGGQEFQVREKIRYLTQLWGDTM